MQSTYIELLYRYFDIFFVDTVYTLKHHYSCSIKETINHDYKFLKINNLKKDTCYNNDHNDETYETFLKLFERLFSL